ncbi:hypothetical protein [Desulfovibrio sp. DV]|uniref:hypothetical protein n=1 Tax=Desulfovibrio sp. DV TaxID=1844708 RepID=UPI000B202A2C|nr:hypothetical protein [Desulfovibrio sp. DV]
MEESSPQKLKSLIVDISVGVSIFVFVCFASYKLFVTQFNIVFDFSSLLSLVLALFSIALSALFYFKATETSNTFYNNTYKFTKDIAELLVRIESGFGERLRHLDEGYNAMCANINMRPNLTQLQDIRQEVEESKEELKGKVEERTKIIEELADKARLQEEEKQKFINEIELKDKELDQKRAELARLIKKLDNLTQSSNDEYDQTNAMTYEDGPCFNTKMAGNLIRKIIVPTMRQQMGEKNFYTVKSSCLGDEFQQLLRNGLFSKDSIDLFQRNGIVDDDNEITPVGISMLKRSRNNSNAYAFYRLAADD